MSINYFNTGSFPLVGFQKFEGKEVRHFMTTRLGGNSVDDYASMNLGRNTQDDPQMVDKNYQKLFDELKISPENMILPNQTHGTRVAIIGEDFPILTVTKREEYLKSCDALITDQQGLLLGVLTADCAPILFHDPVQRVVAVAHAGWRGTVDGIVLHVVQTFLEKYLSKVEDIQVGIGPYISKVHYEVSEDVILAFEKVLSPTELEQCIERKGIQFYLDFGKVNVMLLIREGIPEQNIEMSNLCTYASPLFYSYRKQQGFTGRFLSAIGL